MSVLEHPLTRMVLCGQKERVLYQNTQSISNYLKATLVDMRFVKPLDEKLLKKLLNKAELFISFEDGSVMGGAGSAVQEFASKENLKIKDIGKNLRLCLTGSGSSIDLIKISSGILGIHILSALLLNLS